ncbi:MAG: DUF4131 domain-containing protein [Chloroflexi bacterium]|nr:DUF4131 domain-containing protein [Chloroflexota bacterium]
MLIVYWCVAWLAGIGLGQQAGLPAWVWAAAALIFVIVALLSPKQTSLIDPKPFWRSAFSCGAVFALAALRLSLANPAFDETDVATYNDADFVTLRGWIVDAPDIRDNHTNLRVQAESIEVNFEPHEVNGLVLVQAPHNDAYRYGDQVEVRGQINTPPEFEGFSYRDYLARQGVYSLLQFTQVEILEGRRRGSPLRALMLDLRTAANHAIIRLLPDPQASLLAGILLGIESGISPEVREAFNAVGATHVIAISGSNMAILGGLILLITRRFLPERVAIGLTIGGLFAYASFVGGDAAVMRAAIMTAVGLFATQVGQRAWGLTSLAFTGMIMTLLNPFTLWDVGFQLSFLATLGLILFVDPLQMLMENGLSVLLSAERAKQIMAALSDALVVTIAAQITTTPIIAYHFERFSLLSLPVNLLIIPVQTPLMIIGGIGVILALVIWPLGQIITWGSWLFLSWTWWMVDLFAQLPFASLEVLNPQPNLVWGLYIGMFGLATVANQSEKQRVRFTNWLGRALSTKLVAAAGLIVAAILGAVALSLPDGRMHVTFIDMGAGTSTLIETPSGRHILIDAGNSGRRLSTALGSELGFWERRIDLVILTQQTENHIAGLPPVLNRYDVDAVMTNGVNRSTQLAGEVWQGLEDVGAQEVVAQPGMTIRVEDGVTIEVLHTQSAAPRDEDDAGNPVVLLITYGDALFLIPGDLREEGLRALLAQSQRWRLDVTVLQIPRSGHRDAINATFVEAVNPQVSVLSVDEANRFDLPHHETMLLFENLDSPLYRTDQHGTIRMSTDGGSLWIRTDR